MQVQVQLRGEEGGGLLLVSDVPPYSPKLSQKENDNLVHCLHGIVGGPWLLLTE